MTGMSFLQEALVWLAFLSGLALMCRSGRCAWGLAALVLSGALLLGFELRGLPEGYGLPVESNHRRAEVFLTDPWRQNLDQVTPSFWDRGADVARARATANGLSPLEGVSWGSPSLDPPLYGYLVAMAHVFTGRNIVRIYDWSSLAVFAAVALSFYFWGAPRKRGDPLQAVRCEGLLMAFCLLFLVSQYPGRQAVDLVLTRATFWNAFLLLRPGSVAAYVLLPICFLLLSAGGKARATGAGVCLGGILLLDMPVFGAVCMALVLAAFLARIRANQVDALNLPSLSICLLVALAVSSWWWFPLLTHAIGHTGGIAWRQAFFTLKVQKSLVPWFEPRRLWDPFEATVGMGPIFWLGLAGLAVLWRRGRAGDLCLLGYALAGYALKFCFLPLSMLLVGDAAYAGHILELVLRPAMALAAAVALARGVEHILARREQWAGSASKFLADHPVLNGVSAPLQRATGFSLGKRCALAALCMLILSLYSTPAWYRPERNFWSHNGSPANKASLEALSAWILNGTPPNAVILANSQTAAAIAARTGRKLLSAPDFGPDLADRRERAARIAELLADAPPLPNPVYVVWDPFLERTYPQLTKQALESSGHVDRVWSREGEAVYRIRSEGP